jgi:phosphatidylserine/phosphatidylglycerophosphate/cardiolipin synthase-like enzyme
MFHTTQHLTSPLLTLQPTMNRLASAPSPTRTAPASLLKRIFPGLCVAIALSLTLGSELAQAFELPAVGTLEVAFSPNEGSEELVIKAIDSSRREIRGLAYSFTNPPITQALIRAKKRGVQISWVVDKKSSTVEDRSGKARAALSALVNAGCEVRLIDRFPIHHDKVMIIDQQTVELGSFNFSSAAAHKNSENVLVNWNNPKLAQIYLQHFDRNYQLSQPFQAQY